MERTILKKIEEALSCDQKIALAVITKVWGSCPAPEGSMMAVFDDSSIVGTVGGGSLEAETIKRARECMSLQKNESFIFALNNEEAKESLNTICGGKAEVFIRVFTPKPKLLIAGGGHIAYHLYKLAEFLGLYTVIFEDRSEFANKERFPLADEICLGDIATKLAGYPIDENCYIVLVTRGHSEDEEALKTVINSKAAYIGMIGSKKKVASIKERLLAQGIDRRKLERIYAPIGLAIGGDTPSEIALAIMAEILLVKNSGSMEHLAAEGRQNIL